MSLAGREINANESKHGFSFLPLERGAVNKINEEGLHSYGEGETKVGRIFCNVVMCLLVYVVTYKRREEDNQQEMKYFSSTPRFQSLMVF